MLPHSRLPKLIVNLSESVEQSVVEARMERQNFPIGVADELQIGQGEVSFNL